MVGCRAIRAEKWIIRHHVGARHSSPQALPTDDGVSQRVLMQDPNASAANGGRHVDSNLASADWEAGSRTSLQVSETPSEMFAGQRW